MIFVCDSVVYVGVCGENGDVVLFGRRHQVRLLGSIEIPHFDIINREIAFPGQNRIGKGGALARGPAQQAPFNPDCVRALGRAKNQGLAIASNEERISPCPGELIKNYKKRQFFYMLWMLENMRPKIFLIREISFFFNFDEIWQDHSPDCEECEKR